MFRLTLPRLATPTVTPYKPAAISPQPKLALLPPIPLYRRLLRIHRTRLAPEERVMGDLYMKAEWRRHQKIDNPIHIIGFLTEWQQYGQTLEGDDWKGIKIDKSLLDRLSDQQIGQMYELMNGIMARGRDAGDEEHERDVLGMTEEGEGKEK